MFSLQRYIELQGEKRRVFLEWRGSLFS